MLGLKIDCKIGERVLFVRDATIVENVNELFEIKLQAFSDLDIDCTDLIGQSIDLRLSIDVNTDTSAPEYRNFNGVVAEVQSGLRGARSFRRYIITIRPEFWLLTQCSDYRIWMDKTPVEVLQSLLYEHGLAAPDLSGIIGALSPLHYSVQYGESDFAYVVRRMEDAGLFWWFSHQAGEHKLHVANHPSGWLAPEKEKWSRVLVRTGMVADESIHDWQKVYSVIPRSWRGRDWNFETPEVCIDAITRSLGSSCNGKTAELYTYPSDTSSIEATESKGKLRMQAREVASAYIQGQSDVRFLEAGCRFQPYDTLDGAEYPDEYVVTSIVHNVATALSKNDETTSSYCNHFRAISSSLPLTPLQSMTAPKCNGTQIAIIAGPDDEEIYTDRYGRIKLFFPWDRRAKEDGSDTCWVRVSQLWCGQNAGGQFIPRKGTEVLVAFEDGNPDKPVVVGALCNPSQMPAYELPASRTRMVWRSNSHKGTGFNEVSFEDSSGQENQFFHAQKDRSEKVLNNATKRVDAAYILSVGTNCALEVGGYQKQEIGRSFNLTVGGVESQAKGIATNAAGLLQQSAALLQQANALAGGGSDIEAFSSAFASGSLGFFDQEGTQARGDVIKEFGPADDQGPQLAASGEKIGKALDRMFSQDGIMNTVIGSFKSDTIGNSCIEQVGKIKITNVGSVSVEKVAKTKNIIVGERLCFEVGEAKISLNASGEVNITGKSLSLDFSGSIKLKGKTIHLN